MADEDVSIVVGAQDRASPVLRHIERAVDDVGDKSAGAVPKVEKFGDAVDDAGDASARAVPKHLADAKAIHEVGDEASQAARKVNRLAVSSKSAGGRRGGLMAMFGITGRLAGLFRLALIPTILDAVGALATLGSAAGAAGMAGIGALSPIVGVAGAIPGAIAAAAASFAAFKIGFSGIGDALGAMGDKEKFAEAMKALSPPARAFVNAMKDLRKPWESLKEGVQRSVLPPMTNAIKQLGSAYLPILRRGLIRTGEALGSMVRSVTGVMSGTKARGQVSGIMGANARVIRTLGTAAGPALRALLNVMTAAAPMVQRMARDFADFVTHIAAATESNGLARFFDTAYEVLKKVITFTADLTMALVNVGRIGADLGSDMGASFLNMAARFRDFTESTKGVERVGVWFAEMKPIIWEVGYLIRDISKGLASISMDGTVVDTMRNLRLQFLPNLLDMIQSASGRFLEPFSRALGAILNIVTNLFVLPGLLDLIATALNGIAATVNMLPGPLKAIISLLLTLTALFKVSGFLAFLNGGIGGAAAGAAGKKGMGGFLASTLMTAKAGIGNVGYVAKQVMTSSATAAQGAALLGSSMQGWAQKTNLATKAGHLLRFGYVAAFAAIVMGAIDARNRIDELTGAVDDATKAFTAESTMSNMDALRSQLEGIAKQRADYVSHNPFTALFQGETWSDVWATMTGGQTVNDQMAASERVAQQALMDYERTVGNAARATGVGRDRIIELAESMGLSLDQGVTAASNALTEYVNINEVAAPAVRDLYNGIMASGDAALTASARVDGYAAALSSLAKLTLSGNGATQAAVSAAKAMDGIGRAAVGATVSFKNGNAVWDATAKKNWALNDALVASAEAARLAAVEEFRETGSRRKANAVYEDQYNILVTKVARGLDISRERARMLTREYANVPTDIRTIFKDEGLRDMIEAGRSTRDIIEYINTLEINPKIAPKWKSKAFNYSAWASQVPGWSGPGSKATGPSMTVSPVIKPRVDPSGVIPGLRKVTDLNTGLDDAVGPRTIILDGGQIATPQQQAASLKASLDTMDQAGPYTIDVVINVIDKFGLAEGGLALAGSRHLVGELGPELFVPIGGGQAQVLGGRGPEQRTFPTSGYVIPNDALTRAWESGASALASRGSRRDRGSTTAEPLPAVTVGPVYVQEPIDLQRAVTKGVAEARRNWEERH